MHQTVPQKGAGAALPNGRAVLSIVSLTTEEANGGATGDACQPSAWECQPPGCSKAAHSGCSMQNGYGCQACTRSHNTLLTQQQVLRTAEGDTHSALAHGSLKCGGRLQAHLPQPHPLGSHTTMHPNPQCMVENAVCRRLHITILRWHGSSCSGRSGHTSTTHLPLGDHKQATPRHHTTA